MAKSKSRHEAALALRFRFAVFITVGGVPMLTDLRFQSVDGLDLSRGISWQNSQPFLLKDTQVKTLSLKRGVTSILNGDLSALNVANAGQVALWQDRLVACDLLVVNLNRINVPQAAWLISNAVLKHLSWGSMEGDANEVLIEKMSFDYTQIRPFVL
ncbi:phage tail protein [Parachitinimonas caeni]|uniref:Phage tail protein n=1 Tax=Parachitinimonas caeni TaxID=3031301 RepID=A0ABT7DZH9_9NEIS|nr:phage tail protein [Parachitinimonas caeni]MDK2125462.1 phage tail protein [Parachitinimonas caeni]